MAVSWAVALFAVVGRIPCGQHEGRTHGSLGAVHFATAASPRDWQLPLLLANAMLPAAAMRGSDGWRRLHQRRSAPAHAHPRLVGTSIAPMRPKAWPPPEQGAAVGIRHAHREASATPRSRQSAFGASNAGPKASARNAGAARRAGLPHSRAPGDCRSSRPNSRPKAKGPMPEMPNFPYADRLHIRATPTSSPSRLVTAPNLAQIDNARSQVNAPRSRVNRRLAVAPQSPRRGAEDRHPGPRLNMKRPALSLPRAAPRPAARRCPCEIR